MCIKDYFKYSPRHPFRLLLIFAIIITSIRIIMIAAQVWPVNGDETQYWSWSQHLDWGYYSKPPMLAWLIAITTKLFGDGIVGMRLASPFTHMVTTLMIYLCGARLFLSGSNTSTLKSNLKPNQIQSNQRTSATIGFWSGITYLLLPGVSFSSGLISTDPPLLMFWAISLYCFVRAIENNNLNNLTWWIGLGVALGCGLLSKYAALFFPISMFLYLLFTPKYERALLRTFKPYLSLIIALVILLPNMVWNYHHAFVSLVAVKNNADLAHFALHPLNMLAFIGSQFALFGPILFVLLLVLFFQLPKLWADHRFRLLFLFTIPVLAIMTFEGLISRAHGNWGAPAYVTASILVAAALVLRKKVNWLVIALVFHLILLVALMNVKPIVNAMGIKMHQSTTVINLKEMGKKIETLRQRYPNANVVVDNRMLLTEVLYFGKIPLSQIFKWNPSGKIHDHYDMVTHLQNEIGKNSIIFTYWNNPTSILSRYKMQKSLGTFNLKSMDNRILPLSIFYGTGFKGY